MSIDEKKVAFFVAGARNHSLKIDDFRIAAKKAIESVSRKSNLYAK